MSRDNRRMGDFGFRISDFGFRGPGSNPNFGRRQRRRGVLLLVVLSMLVLFMLIGTAFLMSSGTSKDIADKMKKVNRVGNYATDLLDRAAMNFIRDTENPASVVRDHSLLRDLYGIDGFQGVIYRPATIDFS